MRILFTACVALLISVAQADLQRGLTQNFIDWLNANGYSSYSFNRTDLPGGAYGGKSSDSDKGSGKRPVMFVHGWTDIAVGYTYPG
jgi:hypothetical protein